MRRNPGKFFFQYVVRSNVFISLCAVAFYWSGLLLLGLGLSGIRLSHALLVFFSTLLVYNISQARFGIVHYIRFRSSGHIIAYVAVVICLVFFSSGISWVAWLYLGHLGAVSIIYNSPLLNDFRYLPLRSIPLIKIFIIAYVWASTGSFLPGIISGVPQGLSTWLAFWAQFLFIMGITLPFDIRDFYKDYKNNLKTIPGIIGIRNTKRLSYLFLGAHVLLLFYITDRAWWLAPVVALAMGMTRYASASRPEYYYTFYVDGLIILQFLVLAVLLG